MKNSGILEGFIYVLAAMFTPRRGFSRFWLQIEDGWSVLSIWLPVAENVKTMVPPQSHSLSARSWAGHYDVDESLPSHWHGSSALDRT